MPARLSKTDRVKLFVADCIFGEWTEGDYLPYYPEDFPEVVTLCGSTRFKAAFMREHARLTNEGVIVLTVGRFGQLDGLDMQGDLKKRLDVLHFRKIDMSDRIHVINCYAQVCPHCRAVYPTYMQDVHDVPVPHPECKMIECGGADLTKVPSLPYVGESTRNEINHARKTCKRISYLNVVTE